MILIITIGSDHSTNDVIDWLKKKKAKNIIRINEKDKIENLSIELNSSSTNIYIKIKDQKLLLSNISSIWSRKGRISIDNHITKVITNDNIRTELYKHLHYEEETTLRNFLIHQLESKKQLGSHHHSNANKLISLLYAQEVGLKIPNTIVSTLKNELIGFDQQHDSIITKNIQDVVSFSVGNIGLSNTTKLVNKSDIEEMSDDFFPSQLQKNIKKKYELRIFYLNGACYSMAIFSQEDEQTKVDFRKYNREKPNRTVPYQLPSSIENKLKAFMDKMQLNTGSIDMIVTPELEYVFLEVNPCGQYGMTSIPCNYYLDEKIADFLIA
ncbi:MAG: grasp-with-spasm system ATP-grasp peptide maturase [Hyphomicrobiales bacterium]